MVFNSLEFVVFFPIVTILYFALPHALRWALLLIASCLFYMAFIPAYILILAVTIIVDYFAGMLIEAAKGRTRRLWLTVSIVSNVSFLFFFKYFNFANGNLTALAQFLDWNYPIASLNILLPIGLSFHTFQAMSYTIEVYRYSQKAERNFGIFALYVMFYPQLVAGPIERPQNLLHQFYEVHTFNRARVESGLRLMLWGMFKKVVIADRLAVLVNPVYNDPASFGGLAPLLATLFFAFQIYCDFSGYTDIARGCARVMGFKLMLNFDRPYFSQSISEFWKRWHISLSTWFKDYLYIPLGGNRVSRARLCANLMIVFLVSGLWHGANWTYILWGGLHGLFLIVGVLTLGFRTRLHRLCGLHHVPTCHALMRMAITFTLVTFGWVWFRANNFSDGVTILKSIYHGTRTVLLGIGHPTAGGIDLGLENFMLQGKDEFGLTLVLLVVFLGLEAFQQWMGKVPVITRMPAWSRWVVYEAAILAILFLGEFNAQKFIYFQF